MDEQNVNNVEENVNENPKVQKEPKQEQHMEQHSRLRANPNKKLGTIKNLGDEQSKAIETSIMISITVICINKGYFLKDFFLSIC